MPDHTQQGIAALKAGHKPAALRLLRLAVQDNPKDTQAWLWLTGAVDTDQERLECLQAVLHIDPNNESAARGLAQLFAKGTINIQVSTVPPAPKPTPVSASLITNKAEETIFTDHPSARYILSYFGFSLGIPFILAIILMIWDKSGLFAPAIPFFLLLLAFAFVILVPIIWLIRSTTRYTLTSRKLIVEKGILSRSRKVVPLEKIQDVSYHQEFIQRILGVGDVIVETAGEKGQMAMRNLDKFREYSETILALVQKHS